MKKNVITVLALLCAGVASQSLAAEKALEDTKDYQECMKVMNSAWESEQERFHKMVDFNKSLKSLEDTGFSGTADCMKAISNMSMSSGFSVPGFSDIIGSLVDQVDGIIANQCGKILDKVDSVTSQMNGKLDGGQYSQYLKGVKANWKIGR